MGYNKNLSIHRQMIMGLAIIMIMLFHIRCTPESDVYDWISVFKCFGHWGVDIFLFVSGFGLAYSMARNNLRNFYHNRFIRLFPGCLFLGVLMVVSDSFFNAEESSTNKILQLFCLHKWYIQAIILYYLITPVFYHLFVMKRKLSIGILVAGTLSMYLLSQVFYSFDHVAYYRVAMILERMPVFLFGLFIGIYGITSRITMLISALSLIIAVAIRGISFYLDIYSYNLYFLFLSLGIPFLCMALQKCHKLLVTLRLVPFVNLLGACSLEIYLIHEYLYSVIDDMHLTMIESIIYTILIISIAVWLCKTFAGYFTRTVQRISEPSTDGLENK